MRSLGHIAIFIATFAYVVISQTFSRVLPICGVVSVLPRVDLTEKYRGGLICIP